MRRLVAGLRRGLVYNPHLSASLQDPGVHRNDRRSDLEPLPARSLRGWAPSPVGPRPHTSPGSPDSGLGWGSVPCSAGYTTGAPPLYRREVGRKGFGSTSSSWDRRRTARGWLALLLIGVQEDLVRRPEIGLRPRLPFDLSLAE